MNAPNKPADPLAQLGSDAAADLASSAAPSAPGAPGAPIDQAAAAEAEQAAKTQALIEAGAAQIVLGLLKVARKFIAQQLPEIREEWTDEALQAPAQAAVPLLNKYLTKLMAIAGSSPEAAAFALSLLPLGLGIVNAMDKAAQNEKARQDKAATSG